MSAKKQKLSENKGLMHKIAVLGKDYYTIATIHDLFIFAGAEPSYWIEVASEQYMSQRMAVVYGWIEGLQQNEPEQLDKILEGVVHQIVENTSINEADSNFLSRTLGLTESSVNSFVSEETVAIPNEVETLLEYLIKRLPRAIFPLKFRRKDLPYLDFENEYDVQDLLHSLLRPWIKDIRAEEYTRSYAGSSTRIDFLLPDYSIVCEVKFVRNKSHASKIGDELIIDIAHYRSHQQCDKLWIVIYDPNRLLKNPGGIEKDLQNHSEKISVKVYVIN